jgi:hypothetical protein
MHTEYEARWVSRGRAQALRRSGGVRQGVLLDSFNGFILVGPAGTGLADGPALSASEADYELNPAWCPGPRAKLVEARRLLGLDAPEPANSTAVAG